MKPKANIMHIREHRFLLSERSTLQRLISRTSPGNVFGRMSLERRLQEVEKELEAYEECLSRRSGAYLTFWEAPVVGHHDIHTGFGSEAVKIFAKAVTAVEASQRATLPAQGQIPNCQDYRLLITETAPGAFSFQVKDVAQPPLRTGETAPAENAIAQVKTILAASVGPKEQFKAAIADIDRRALTTLHAFVKILTDKKALCALAFRNDEFHFQNAKQVERSEKRLRPSEQETHATLTVRLHGSSSGNREVEFEFWAVNAPMPSEEAGWIAKSNQGSSAGTDAVDVQAFIAFVEQIANQAEGLHPFADSVDAQTLIAQPVSMDARTQCLLFNYAIPTRTSQDVSLAAITAT